MKPISPSAGWLLIAVYVIAMSLGHLQFSLWLVSEHQTPFGALKPADYVTGFSALTALVLLVYLSWRAYRGANRLIAVVFWLFWLNAVILADLSLTFSVNEYVHYPQYALLAWMLAKVIDPRREHFSAGPVLLIASLFGVADESLQYAYITVSYSEYLDFNDFLINLLAAAAGVLIYYGFAIPASTSKARIRLRHALIGVYGFVLLGGVLFAGASALKHRQIENQLAQLPVIERAPARYGHWLKGPHRGQYWVMDPWTAGLLIGINGVLFSLFPLAVGLGSAKSDPQEPDRERA